MKDMTVMEDAQSIQPNTAETKQKDASPSETPHPDESASAQVQSAPSQIATPTQSDPSQIATPTQSDPSQIATPEGMLDNYRFLRALGQGAQSKVFLAERLSDHQKVAIKQLRIDSIKTWKEYTLFHREAEVLATLDIPGVVKLYEARDCLEADPPCSYIVQEYIEGPTLKKILASGYRFSLAQTYDLILQLIEILKKLHSHEPQVIHRDIKPSNIILRNWENGDFQACLLDFGAVSNPQVQSGGSTIAGTFGYMSPEQLIGRAVPASDTYALAALMAYLLSGVDPAEMTIKDLRLIIDPYVESHPRALVQMLRQMLEPSLDNRLSDLDKIKTRILDFKNNQYNLDLNQAHELEPQNFINHLREVRHLCQPQNLELWQSLPDDPLKRPKLNAFFATQPRFQHYPNRLEESDYELIAKILTVAVFLTLGMIVTFISGEIDSFFISIPLCICFWYIVYIPIRLFQQHVHKPKINSIRFGYRRTPMESPRHARLYQSGIKTIATITQISFIACDQDAVNLKSTHSHPRIEVPPTYAITYKFNPPDDDTANDIFHTIHTHVNPENLFKPGDPLPILYQTEKTKSGLPKVTQSMPFPLPLSDLDSVRDYIYINSKHNHSNEASE